MEFSIDSTTWRTPNYWRDAWSNPLTMTPSGLIIHTGEGNSAESDLSWLCYADSGVSAHYYIKRTGEIFQLVPDHYRAWHAAEYNHWCIGIEAEHKQGQDWPAIQREAYAWLVRHLIRKYNLPQHNIRAHRWVSPQNRSDPTNWDDQELTTWIAAFYTPVEEPRPYSRRIYGVTANQVNVRNKPSTSGNIIDQLNEGTYIDVAALVPGTKVKIGDRTTDIWLRLRNNSYISAAFAKLMIRRFVFSNPRNFRDKPTTASAIISNIPAGREVEVAEVVAGESVAGSDLWGRTPARDDYIWLGEGKEKTNYPI